jgi:hypothetical protein
MKKAIAARWFSGMSQGVTGIVIMKYVSEPSDQKFEDGYRAYIGIGTGYVSEESDCSFIIDYGQKVDVKKAADLVRDAVSIYDFEEWEKLCNEFFNEKKDEKA